MKIEPHGDDVVSMEPDKTLMRSRTLKISELPQGFKELLLSSVEDSAFDLLDAWLNEGVECEFLRASTGGGWQTGKIRIRFEFVPDVPDSEESQSSPG
jgi:hypothetical protein